MIRNRVVAAKGQWILVTPPGRPGGLRIPFPSRTGTASEGFTGGSGRYVALTAGDPAYHGGPQQQLDVWVLDLRSGRLLHVPGMPSLVPLKATGLAWSADDRLIILTQARAASHLQIWRPGARRLSYRTVPGSEPNSGSDTMVVLAPSR